MQAYGESPDAAYAEPNFKLHPAAAPNDPSYNSLWGLNNTGQSGGTPDADIDAPGAWDTATGGPDSVVGVIDEGIDVNHPDLSDNIWTNSGEVAGSKLDDAGNGDEHGTHVAGTISAVGNNGVGIAGVNWDA